MHEELKHDGEIPGLFNPPRDFDEHGHLIPRTVEERRARFEEGSRILAERAKITDETDTDELWAEAMRNLGVETNAGGSLIP